MLINRFLMVFLLVLVTTNAFADDSKKEEAALSAAESWLELVDAGSYAESWEEAASYFKGAIQEDKWVQSLRGVRAPLGQVLSRKLKSETYRSSLPGAPDGEYVIIQFDTSFQNKKSSVETVTPMLDNGEWESLGVLHKIASQASMIFDLKKGADMRTLLLAATALLILMVSLATADDLEEV